MAGKVAAFIFGCTDATEPECYSKSLFGITKQWLSAVSGITPGTPLFLYNYDSQSLFGLFEADSGGAENIDPSAWGGRFPAQVKFRRTKTCPSIQKTLLERLLNFQKGRPYPILTTEQLVKLTGLFEGRLPPQSPPAEKRYKTADGHWVRSRGEVIIDDCLFRHTIASRLMGTKRLSPGKSSSRDERVRIGRQSLHETDL
jgi:Development and cell death domain